MSHEVYTAVDGELHQAQLPLYKGERQVRAALIVAVGLSPTATMTRLALAGAAHVDVSKAWMQKNAAKSGQYYVQGTGEDEAPEAMTADAFEAQFTLESDAAADKEQLGEGFQAASGHIVENFATLDEHPGFVEWFKDHATATLLGEKLASLFNRIHLHGGPTLPHGTEQFAGEQAPMPSDEVKQLRLERDGARLRIQQLEKELAARNTQKDAVADVAQVSEDKPAGEATEAHESTEEKAPAAE